MGEFLAGSEVQMSLSTFEIINRKVIHCDQPSSKECLGWNFAQPVEKGLHERDIARPLSTDGYRPALGNSCRDVSAVRGHYPQERIAFWPSRRHYNDITTSCTRRCHKKRFYSATRG